jgi:hypothetical protein
MWFPQYIFINQAFAKVILFFNIPCTVNIVRSQLGVISLPNFIFHLQLLKYSLYWLFYLTNQLIYYGIFPRLCCYVTIPHVYTGHECVEVVMGQPDPLLKSRNITNRLDSDLGSHGPSPSNFFKPNTPTFPSCVFLFCSLFDFNL